MNAARVGKSILSHDGLVALHHKTAHARDQPRRLHDLAGLDAALEALVVILARLQRHDQFLQRSVTGSFTNAVDGALDLPGTILDCGQ